MEKETKQINYSPINLEYFLNMEIANGGPSKQIITLNGKLKTIKDLVSYWKHTPKPQLTPDTWQYYNCMMAGFKHKIENHHDIGWDSLTEEYYSSKTPMSDEEIEEYLKSNPVEFENGFIKHNYHRALAMVGRLINNKPYIPFYMETSQIYAFPRIKDNKHRIKPLTNKIKLLKKLDVLSIDRKEYCLCQSSILSIMGIRDNDGLDIIISTNLRKQNINYPQGIEVFNANRKKFDYFGAEEDDDILNNYCIEIDGYKFLEPRFYFARKFTNNSLRDKKDWDGIKLFFKKELHKGYPFNFEFYKWGLPLMVERIKSKELDLSQLKLIKDKYNRIADGVNQGRAVYEGEGYYVKIFHPEYCRLQNFRDALNSGFLNGLVPSLTHLLEDDNGDINGYITLSGKTISDNEWEGDKIPQWFIRTVLRNCKQRKKIFYDLVPINIIRDPYYNQISLIDLESVYDLDKLNDMKKHNAKMKPSSLLDWIDKI